MDLGSIPKKDGLFISLLQPLSHMTFTHAGPSRVFFLHGQRGRFLPLSAEQLAGSNLELPFIDEFIQEPKKNFYNLVRLQTTLY